jgi:hypothetical protein
MKCVLAVSYTYSSLGVSDNYLQSAYSNVNARDKLLFNLGMDNYPKWKDEQEEYWRTVKEAIVEVGRGSMYRISELLLCGQ